MSTDTLDIRFGLTEESQQRFRNLQGRFTHLDDILRSQLEASMDRITTELESHLRAEFIAGGHDRTGYTLDTIEAHTEGLTAWITMGGGASFVEQGRGAIDFTGMPYPLHWLDPFTGEDVYRYYSGSVEADPFVERAINDLDLHFELSRLATGFATEVVREGDYGTSIGEHA